MNVFFTNHTHVTLASELTESKVDWRGEQEFQKAHNQSVWVPTDEDKTQYDAWDAQINDFIARFGNVKVPSAPGLWSPLNPEDQPAPGTMVMVLNTNVDSPYTTEKEIVAVFTREVCLDDGLPSDYPTGDAGQERLYIYKEGNHYEAAVVLWNMLYMNADCPAVFFKLPTITLTGFDGNMVNAAVRVLCKNGMEKQAERLVAHVNRCTSGCNTDRRFSIVWGVIEAYLNVV